MNSIFRTRLLSRGGCGGVGGLNELLPVPFSPFFVASASLPLIAKYYAMFHFSSFSLFLTPSFPASPTLTAAFPPLPFFWLQLVIVDWTKLLSGGVKLFKWWTSSEVSLFSSSAFTRVGHVLPDMLFSWAHGQISLLINAYIKRYLVQHKGERVRYVEF